MKLPQGLCTYCSFCLANRSSSSAPGDHLFPLQDAPQGFPPPGSLPHLLSLDQSSHILLSLPQSQCWSLLYHLLPCLSPFPDHETGEGRDYVALEKSAYSLDSTLLTLFRRSSCLASSLFMHTVQTLLVLDNYNIHILQYTFLIEIFYFTCREAKENKTTHHHHLSIKITTVHILAYSFQLFFYVNYSCIF